MDRSKRPHNSVSSSGIEGIKMHQLGSSETTDPDPRYNVPTSFTDSGRGVLAWERNSTNTPWGYVLMSDNVGVMGLVWSDAIVVVDLSGRWAIEEGLPRR